MKSKSVAICLAAIMLFVIGFAATTYAQQSLTVTGELTDDFAIETDDGEIYDVAEDETAMRMFEEGPSRVSASGTLIDTDDGPVFKVNSYKFLNE